MSTKMTDTDWANALEVFRACLPRRGRKATDDRLFLEDTLLHGGECALAGAAGALRPLELGVEAF